MSCTICLEGLKAPVSLPCGHIFCKECVARTVQSRIQTSSHQKCPLCRAPFVLFHPDPSQVPNHLRPFIQPAIRNVYIESTPGASTSSPHLGTPSDTAEAEVWRRRAQAQQTTMANLAKYAQVSREQAARAEAQRSALERECTTLKKQLNVPTQYECSVIISVLF